MVVGVETGVVLIVGVARLGAGCGVGLGVVKAQPGGSPLSDCLTSGFSPP